MPTEMVTVGVYFTALFKCEEEDCGRLFVTTAEHIFPDVETAEAKETHTQIKCPKGHGKVRFIQSVERNPMVIERMR